MSKGISPLIASVLLLAVTLSIASIFSGWGPQIINDITERTENQTTRTIDCNEADVNIESAKYFQNDGETTVVVRNNGVPDLDDLTVSTWQGSLPMNETTTSLGRGNFTSVNVTTNDEPDRVEVYSRRCSSVTADSEDINK